MLGDSTTRINVGFAQNAGMDRLEIARLDWQRAQAELQSALADLERLVASMGGPDELIDARKAVERRQKSADEFLHRYITQLGKS
jgi:hypothetical protein